MLADDSKSLEQFEEESYLELSSQEKLTLILTISFSRLLQAFYANNPPFSKVDIAFVDNDSISLYSYNNGIEVSYYTLYADENDQLKQTFFYVPGAENPPRNRTLGSHVDLTNKRKITTLLSRFFTLRARENNVKENPCDPLAKVWFIGTYKKMQLFAIPVGFSFHISKPSFFILQKLFFAFSEKIKPIMPNIEKALSTATHIEAAIPLLDYRSIILETCEISLESLVYGKQQSNSEQYLYDIICTVASMPYEHRANTGMFLFADARLLSSNKLMKFETPLRIDQQNIREIRKLLETSKKDTALLMNKGTIIGIIEKPNSVTGIQFSGAGNWTLLVKSESVLTFSQNKCFLTRKSDQIDFPALYQENFPNHSGAEDILQIIRLAEQQQHGTAIIISEDATQEADRLCSFHRGIRVQPLSLSEHTKLINSLTSIDGALIVDTNGNCLAIGIILDGDAQTQGSTARGARFNSVKNYIERQRKRMEFSHFIGVVISEDGSVDFIATNSRTLENCFFYSDDET